MSDMEKEVEARRSEERRLQNVTLSQGAIDELCKGIVERDRLLAAYRNGHSLVNGCMECDRYDARCWKCKAVDALKAAK